MKHGFPFLGKFFAQEGDRIVLTPGNFFEKGGFKRTFGKEKYYTGPIPQEYICSKGDLIVAMTEQAEGLLGSTAIVPEDDIYLHNQRIGLISCNDKLLDKLYAYYLLMTKSVRKQLRDSSSGTKVKHTSPEKIYDVQVFLPELHEQKKISSLVWAIDSKIELNNRISAELEAMAKMLYDYWFVQFDFPDENGKPYRSSGGEMVWNDELKREIPKGWTKGTIGDLGEIVSGGTPSTTIEDYYAQHGIAWITPNDLSSQTEKMFVSHGERDITLKGLNNSSAVLMPAQTVLLSSRAPIGYLAIAANELTTNQGFKSIVPCKGYGCFYIYYTLKSHMPFILQQGSGTTFKEVSKDALASVVTVLPNRNIVTNFETRLSAIGNKRKNIEDQSRELAKLRDWLLPMLMNGQAWIKENN